jgi:murein DD-endopeptidase MepM/ murein hydrolase activator NlpD
VSAASIAERVQGAAVKKGEVIGRMGERHENGSWFPHTHFQLSLLEPVIADLPGVVFKGHRATALRVYPDPRLVLGPLW